MRAVRFVRRRKVRLVSRRPIERKGLNAFPLVLRRVAYIQIRNRVALIERFEQLNLLALRRIHADVHKDERFPQPRQIAKLARNEIHVRRFFL